MTNGIRPSGETANTGRGRPSIYTKALARKICERLASGESLRSICADAAMPNKSTVCRWLQKDLDFRGQYMSAREIQAELLGDAILDLATSEPYRNPANWKDVKLLRNQVGTMQWYAQKLVPKRWRLDRKPWGPPGAS